MHAYGGFAVRFCFDACRPLVNIRLKTPHPKAYTHKWHLTHLLSSMALGLVDRRDFLVVLGGFPDVFSNMLCLYS